MLIILDVDTFIRRIERPNAVIIVYEYVDDSVTFSFHAQLVQNFDQIMSLIHTKQAILAVSSNAYIKNLLHFSQILDFEHLTELLFESFNLLEKPSAYINVVHVNKKNNLSR